VRDDGIVHLDDAVVNAFHQIDAPARGIHFIAP
jgi:hypothetical protein